MKNQMNIHPFVLRICLSFIVLLINWELNAQTPCGNCNLYGPDPAATNKVSYYSLSIPFTYNSVSWYTDSGTPVSNSSSNDVSITWSTPMNDVVNYDFRSNGLWFTKSKDVTVSNPVGQVNITGGIPGGGDRCEGTGTTDFNAFASYATNYAWSITPGAGTIDNTGLVTWNSSFSGTATISVTAYGVGGSSSSDSENVTVNALPTAYSVTGGGAVCSISSGALISLSDSQSGVNYQLKRGGANIGSPVSGTGIGINFGYHNIEGTYIVEATSANGCTNTMAGSASISFYPALTSGSISGVHDVCLNGNPTALSSSSPPTGGSGTYYYQWQKSTDESSWSNISGANSITYDPPSGLTLDTWYRRKVESCGEVKYTNSIKVTVNPLPELASGSDQVRCGSGTITLTASPGSNGNTIRWYAAATGGSHLAQNTTYSPNLSSTTTYYVASYNSSTGCEDTDRRAIVAYVDLPTVAGSVSAANNVCGSGTHNFSISGYTGTIERWQSRYKNGSGSWTSWSTFTETDNLTSVSPTLSQWNSGVRTYEVRAVVKSGTTCSTLYATKSVTVDPVTVAGSVSAANNVCGSGTHNFSISGYTGTIERWQSRYKNGSGSWTSWSTFTETDNLTSVSPTLSQWNSGVRTYEVRAVVKSGYNCNTLYPSKFVTINPIPGLASGSDQSRCGSGTVTLTATPGSNGNTIRWYNSDAGGTLLAEGTSYSPSVSAPSTTFYAATYNSTTLCEGTDRKAIAAIVNPIPGLASGSDQSRCGSGTVTLTATPGSNGNTIRWYNSDTGGTLLAEGISYSPSVSAPSTSFYAASYNSITQCEDTDRVEVKALITSDVANVSIYGGPAVRWQDSGVSTTFTGSADNETAWEWGISPLTAGSISASGTITWNTNFCGIATVSAIASNICYADTITTTVEVVPQPQILVMGSSNIGGAGEEVKLSANGTFTSYQWKRNGTNVSGGTGQTLTTTMAGDYTLTVTQASISPDPTTSVPITVTANTGLDLGARNYVISTTVEVSGKTTSAQVEALTSDDKSVVVQFADGLGRATQSIAVEASPNKEHIVSPIAYDEYGRQTITYLPYVVLNNSGVYQNNPVGSSAASATYTLSPQYSFYQSSHVSATDASPYSQTVIEKSPLSRTLEQGAPGAAWQPGSGHTVTVGYDVNVDNEVRYYEVGEQVPVQDGYYPGGDLSKSTVADEDGNEVVEFTDKFGNTILKRVETGDVNDPWADTYYVYDIYNNLRVVLPPEANKAINANSLTTVPPGYTLITDDHNITSANYSGGSYMYVETATVTIDPGVTLNPGSEIIPYQIGFDFLDLWAFQYKYDGLNRMIEKKVPGAGWVYMVYDKMDRLVLTQDANQRNANQWTFTKYDKFSRPVLTGFYTSSSSHTALQTAVYAHGTLYETVGTTVLGYTNSAYPSVSNANDYLSATYYDSYANLPTAINSFTYVQELGNSSNNTNLKGQVVGSQAKILDGSNTWLKTKVFYDDRYRVIQTIADHQLGDADRVTNKYDFAGKLIETQTLHAVPAQSDLFVRESYTYDHVGRLLQVDHEIDNKGSVVLLKNEYNAIGELIDKKLHSTNSGSTFEQSVNYGYNIRGWLVEINKPDLIDGEGDYFGMKLFYNEIAGGINSPSFNGNISAAKWSVYSHGSNIQAGYTYEYDGMNRLTGANYVSFDGGFSDPTTFDVSNISYDLNGNILNLARNAASTTLALDDMDYTYSGNQLLSVTDNGNVSYGFVDGNTSGNDYVYDNNGNMTSDANKDITTISYNHLNLPQTVAFTGNRSIIYTYDAAGIKLAKTVNDNGSTTVTDYVGGFIYEDDVLKQLAHAEGRVRNKDNNGFVYDYYLKDHLGNTRITFTTENEEVVYLATMETEYQAFEDSVFLNISVLSETSIYNYTMDAATSEDKVIRLRGSDASRRLGPGKLLQVMRGDTLDMEVFAYHGSGYIDGDSVSSSGILSALIGLISGTSPAGTETANIQTTINANAGSIFVGQNELDEDSPRAYLNYVLFDKEFEFVDAGFAQVTNDTINDHQRLLINKAIKQAGYAYVYISNESNTSHDVYFDDLRITHTKSKVLQEDHYYPFGLNISALSSTAPLSKPNKYDKFNGKEFDGDLDLGMYNYGTRLYEPTIGRWNGVDAYAEKYGSMSPYHFAGNTPTNAFDVDGNLFVFANGFMPNHYWAGIQPQRIASFSRTGRLTYLGPNPSYSHYAPDRGFNRNAPQNNGKGFKYWGEIGRAYMDTYSDHNAVYTNGSHTPKSTASARFKSGQKAGQDLISQLDNRTISLDAGETIKVVGHSQGAAYAAGIATELAKHDKYGSLLEFVDYISPHQPGGFSHPDGIAGRQFSTISDMVSSLYTMGRLKEPTVISMLQKLISGNSGLERIDGIERENYHERESYQGGYGGHMIDTWIDYFRDMGISVNVIGGGN